MNFSAIGLVLLFTANQSNVIVTAPFPPFGLAASSLIGLSSYLVLVGIYCSATSLANDSKLRQTIKKQTMAELKFFVSMGTAQMQKEVEGRIMEVAKKLESNLVEESGIQPSMTDSEMREYLNSVLDEIKTFKKKS